MNESFRRYLRRPRWPLGTVPGVGDLPSSGNRGTGPSLPAQSGRRHGTHQEGLGVRGKVPRVVGTSNEESRLGGHLEKPLGGSGVWWGRRVRIPDAVCEGDRASWTI